MALALPMSVLREVVPFTSLQQLPTAAPWVLGGLDLRPVLQTVSINTQTLFLTTSNWIEETDTLDEAAITGAAAVGYGQMIKRALFRATT